MVLVITLPLLPLSNNASTDSWSILFSFLTIMSGALRSNSLFNLLFLLITLRYKSFRSEVAKRPPSKGTRGLNSGGITGSTFKTIHSGLIFEFLKPSITFILFSIFFFLVSDDVASLSSTSFSISASKLILDNISWTASAPIPCLKESSPNWSIASSNSSSFKSWFGLKPDIKGSITIWLSKYKTFSRFFRVMSSARPILLGSDFKNQIWATGAANSIWAILSLLTLESVTSTPHFSHVMPLNFILLYFPHKHS